MTGDELRQAYLDFFKSKEHLILPSAPLVPKNDPSLLWINAGMAPFKTYFNGQEIPPSKRIATSQKCIRTNDIENVGKTARHHTFFEMLGNFSFGDYFKEEAITWAWEFVTENLKLDKDKLWITIYENDDEAFAIWHEKIGLAKERIMRMGKKENFWQIGTGPCGPCSEIHYDRGPEYGTGPEDVVAGEGDRYLEIWNLVFTQYDYTEEGEYLTLPNKNIDTGMGLERVASILQDVDTNYETDFFMPVIDFIEEDTGIPYRENGEITTAYRVIADHIRGITMAIFDGVLPANEGRGYVIRRLIRRAVRYGGKLGYKQPFLFQIVPVVIENMKSAYPRLADRQEHIQSIIEAEEDRFYQTLDQGLSILNNMVKVLKEENNNILSGKAAFKLYDTYGFPFDLTKDILSEKEIKIDEEEFNMEMEKQRERARKARDDEGFTKSEVDEIYKELEEEIEKTEFIGYRNLTANTKITGIIKKGKEVEKINKGDEAEVILKRTPFYAESGGQVGDVGILEGKNVKVKVNTTYKKADYFIHKVSVKEGSLKKGQAIKAQVSTEKRWAAARNHTATHLLHQVLRDNLGEHVKQSGSLVSDNRLRFDFSHFSALSQEVLSKIEKEVNEKILANMAVETIQTTVETARDMGATALFTEKYGKQVRVIKIGDYSIELCGGTHVDFTGDIGLFKITGESGIAAGIRRIEAVTGKGALAYVNNKEKILADAANLLNTTEEGFLNKIEQLIAEKDELKKEITSLNDRLANFKSRDLLQQVEDIDGLSLLTAEVQDMDSENLRKLADELKNELKSGIIVLASNLSQKVIFVAVVTDDLLEKGYHAGKLIAKVAKITGGGGGGRPDMAEAGGSKTDKIKEALAEVKNLI